MTRPTQLRNSQISNGRRTPSSFIHTSNLDSGKVVEYHEIQCAKIGFSFPSERVIYLEINYPTSTDERFCISLGDPEIPRHLVCNPTLILRNMNPNSSRVLTTQMMTLCLLRALHHQTAPRSCLCLISTRCRCEPSEIYHFPVHLTHSLLSQAPSAYHAVIVGRTRNRGHNSCNTPSYTTLRPLRRVGEGSAERRVRTSESCDTLI